MNLPIHKGGLGLRNNYLTSRVAFAASILEENHRLWQASLDDLLTHELKLFVEFGKALVTLGVGANVAYNLTYNPTKGSIQHQLQVIVDELEFTRIQSVCDANAEKAAWWRSIQGEEAGSWLSCLPTYQKLKLSNEE